MGLEWTDKWNGWRSLIKLDLPAHSELYTSDNTMIKYSDVPPFRTGHKVTGDVSSCNVIVVGRDGHYILAGAVTAFRSQTILRALLEQHRITGIEASTKYTNWTILLLPFRSHDMPLQIREGAETHFDIDWQ